MIDSELSGVFPWSHSLGLFISCTFLFFLGGGVSAPFRAQMAHAGCCVNHILQQCNKASHGEPFTITFSYASALPAVDVNGVLLVAAAPLKGLQAVRSNHDRSLLDTLPTHG